ncbi:MAG: hypothetical protein AAGC56_05010 [Pseudomonadota bacterium]
MIDRLDGLFRKKPQTILGHRLPSPRMTRDGFVMMLSYFAAPLIVALTAVDALIYVVLRYAFDICYGLWCWL